MDQINGDITRLKESDHLEVRLVQRDLHNLSKAIMEHEFKRIRVLEIQRNRVTELEGSVFMALRNLQHLNASKNCVERVSSEIRLCKELEKVILDDNMIRELPEEIGQL